MKRFAIALVVAVALLGRAASAAPVQVSDPDDVASIVDVRTVFASNTATTVTYFVEWFDPVPDAGWSCDLRWDFNADGTTDGYLQFAFEFGPTALVYASDFPSAVGQAAIQRAPVATPHTSPTSNISNTVRIDVERAAMVAASMPPAATGYEYRVSCRQNTPQVDDDTDFVRHNLVAAPCESPGCAGQPPVLQCPAALNAPVLAAPTTLTVTATDPDAGQTVTLTQTSGPGTLTSTGTNPVTGTLTYAPTIVDWFTDFVTPIADAVIRASDGVLATSCTIATDVVLFPGSPF